MPPFDSFCLLARQGVHARDASGNYYTILESPDYTDETSGLGKVEFTCRIWNVAKQKVLLLTPSHSV